MPETHDTTDYIICAQCDNEYEVGEMGFEIECDGSKFFICHQCTILNYCELHDQVLLPTPERLQ